MTLSDKFPETIFVSFDEDSDADGGGFHLVHRTVEESVTSTVREQIATYKRVKVEEWKLTPEALTEIG